MVRIQKSLLRHQKFIVHALKTKGNDKVLKKKKEIENGFPIYFGPFHTSPHKATVFKNQKHTTQEEKK